MSLEELEEEEVDDGEAPRVHWLVEDDLPYTIEAKESDRVLGFAMSGEPWEGDIMYVRSVVPDGWAARQGVEVEDVLLASSISK